MCLRVVVLDGQYPVGVADDTALTALTATVYVRPSPGWVLPVTWIGMLIVVALGVMFTRAMGAQRVQGHISAGFVWLACGVSMPGLLR